EMPGMYQAGDYDLAGFSVGIVEKSALIDGSRVVAGDVLIAMGSSGPHSNGYSLIRKILHHSGADIHSELDGKPLGEQLLEPTRIYVKPLLELMQQLPIHALAHITGGGLSENIPRVLPDYTVAEIDRDSWQWPTIFQWLQQQGNVVDKEMIRTFNCGIGMVVVVAAEDAEQTIETLTQQGETVWKLGSIGRSEQQQPSVV
ncbi:MAG: phosphoribosylformylglycinamidine cyclo-ligase, partial [Gammaproteobacteria bacterium]|nr:phosphoribosylformylglycinamidine cyclo-ligase [Gammaproteobacteria bacterium]